MSSKSETAILFPAESPPDPTPALPSPSASARPPFGGRRPGPRPRRTFDYARLLMALLLGVVTWLAIDFKRMDETTVQATVVLRAPADMQVARASLDQARVTLRGPRTAVQALPRMVRLEATVAPAMIVDGRVTITLADLRPAGIPETVHVRRTDPEQLTFALATRETAQLDVEVVLTGEPAAGFEVGTVAATPPQVTVSGPDVGRLFMQRAKVRTEPIDLAGRDRVPSQRVRLQPLHNEGGVALDLDRDELFVTVEIREAAVTADIADVPIRMLMSPMDLLRDARRGRPGRLAPSTATVTVEGPRLIVGALAQKPDILVVYAATAMMEPDPDSADGRDFLARVQWSRPEGVTIKKVEPERVRWRMDPPAAP